MNKNEDSELGVSAVILAGGSGLRMHNSKAKQLLKIAGKPILEHTLETFCSIADFTEILVVVNSEYESDFSAITARLGDHRISLVAGGNTRSESTLNALLRIKDQNKVLIHDAVRPFITVGIIRRVIEALDFYEAVDTVTSTADTIVEVDSGNLVVNIPARDSLRRGQTPQGFIASTLKTGYSAALEDPNFAATDDCGVIKKYMPDKQIFCVNGSSENIKITEPIDLTIADGILQSRTEPLCGQEKNLHSVDGQVMVVMGGSSGIGKSIVDLGRTYGATVYDVSRSTSGTDITDCDQVRKAVESIISKSGKIDHVVITAGVLYVQDLSELSYAAMQEMIQVNFLAPTAIASLVYPHLQASKGSLTLFSSSSYSRGRASYSVYSATKAAIANLTQALAEEWSDSQVRINAVSPQRTNTPMRSRAFGAEQAETLLDPRQVAEKTLTLIATGITGQIIDVRL